jgi:hypothetical protein
MEPLVLDISDPKCDIRNLFQQFINQPPTLRQYPFCGKDVWMWIARQKLSDMKYCNEKMELLVTVWLYVKFIKYSSPFALSHKVSYYFEYFEIVNEKDWCIKD